MTEKIELVIDGEIEKFSLKSGDIVVANINRNLNSDDMKQFSKQLKSIFPDNNVLIVQKDEVELKIISGDEND